MKFIVKCDYENQLKIFFENLCLWKVHKSFQAFAFQTNINVIFLNVINIIKVDI